MFRHPKMGLGTVAVHHTLMHHQRSEKRPKKRAKQGAKKEIVRRYYDGFNGGPRILGPGACGWCGMREQSTTDCYISRRPLVKGPPGTDLADGV